MQIKILIIRTVFHFCDLAVLKVSVFELGNDLLLIFLRCPRLLLYVVSSSEYHSAERKGKRERDNNLP